MFFIGLCIGLFIGIIFGIVIMAACAISGKNHTIVYSRNKKGEE